MEEMIKIRRNDIEDIKRDLALIKKILLAKGVAQTSLEEEFNSWEILSDEALEDFEESL
jgi:hypothetical protein